jgi:DNA-binding transcriptional MocR family regulator
VRDLAAGNPDPALLPDLGPVLRTLDPPRRLYGEEVKDPALVALAARQMAADGLPAGAHTVVSGALDGLERVMQAHLRPGDRVAVEDPAFSGVLALLQPLSLVPLPVAIDDRGLRPEALEAALAAGARAVIATPRAQNPTGAAFDARRARALRALLRHHPDVLVLEDDHAGPVSGAEAHTLAGVGDRWAVVRSFSKSLGPDLRVAVMLGDEETTARVEGRQLMGMRWVSHILQQLVVRLASARGSAARLREAAASYSLRRDALLDALAEHGIQATGRSGLNVWIPLAAEAPVVQGLLDAGWSVAAGERFRLQSGPAIRVTSARLDPADARRFAAALAAVLAPSERTYPS